MEIKVHLRLSFLGQSTDHHFEVSSGTNFEIGRTGRDLQIPDASVSRAHCTLMIEDSDLVLKDNGSRNGIHFNGKPVTQHLIRSDAFLRIGDVDAHFISVEPIVEAKLGLPTEAPAGFQRMPKAPKPQRETPREVRKKEASANPLDEITGFDAILALYKKMALSPREFFDETEFDGPLKRSFVVIAIASFASVLLSSVSWMIHAPASAMGLITVPIMVVVMTALTCAIAHALRGFLQCEGEYRQFVRFSAYYMLFSIPIGLLAVLSAALAALAYQILVIAGIWGFIRVFKPNVVRYFALCVLAFVLPTVGMFSLAMVGSQRPTSPEQSVKTLSSLISTFNPQARQGLNEVQKLMPSEFRAGETYFYEVDDMMDGALRKGGLSVAVKQVDGMKLSLHVKGSLGVETADYEQQVNLESDLGALMMTAGLSSAAGGPRIPVYVSQLLVTRMVVSSIAVAAPLAAMMDKGKKIDFPRSEPVTVAGFAAHRIKNWDRQPAADNSGTELVLSPELALPAIMSNEGVREEKRHLIRLVRVVR